MTLDDRLRTVLDVAADSGEASRAQYRQLVDLLGSGKAVADGALVAAAFLRLSSLARRIPAVERAAILADPALRLRSPPLVAQLCEGEPEIAAAAIAAADLDQEGWTILGSVIGEDMQARVRNARMTERARQADTPDPLVVRTPPRDTIANALTPSANVPERVRPADGEKTGDQSKGSDISEIVARIERYRLARREAAMHDVVILARGADEEEARAAAPPVAAPREIDCVISPDGRIGWASKLGPMLSGLVLSANPDATARLDEASATALRRQQAVRGGRIAITASPTVTGDWRLDAAPNFDPVGRFLGHHARLTREIGKQADPRGDLIRQALHELRTPINALQGFSEIIQQQLFGPVPHQYRSLAANIAGETAALLAGLEEIDRLVRLRGGSRRLAAGTTDIGPVLETLIDQVVPLVESRGAHLDAHYADPQVAVAFAESELQRMIWRLLGVVAVAASDGDRVTLDLSGTPESLRLAVGLPRALAALGDDLLYRAAANDDAKDITVGLLGRGFALRLLTAEARAAGGSLVREGAMLVLTLPCEAIDRAARDEAAA